MKLKILIAAGGTGGHIYPALAIADAFRRFDNQSIIEFVGTAHGLENKIIPPKGYRVHHLPIGRLNSNVPLTERIKTLLLLPVALFKSATLLRKEKPDFVLGVGGHASGPLLLMAALLGKRSAIWEPNAMPGMANRWLSGFVDDCWVVFDEARLRLKSQRIHGAGMPVRQEIESASMQKIADPVFNILIFGGSQGARGINNTAVEMVRAGGDWLAKVRIVHQTGPADYPRIREAYKHLPGVPVEVHEYLHDMPDRYKQADLVICRSGTGTLSELAACGKAAILIPFPFASDDHQRKNAESLVNKSAAIMILQKDLSAQRLSHEIQDLMNAPERLRSLSENVRQFHQPRAAETLVKEFVERIQNNNAIG